MMGGAYVYRKQLENKIMAELNKRVEFGTKVYGVDCNLKIYTGVIISINGDIVNILDQKGNRFTSTKSVLAFTPREAYQQYRLILEDNLKKITTEQQKLIDKLYKLERNCI